MEEKMYDPKKEYIARQMISKGKTKEIWSTDDPDIVIVRSTKDITAGDGLMHDTFDKKAQYANETVCNVYEYLKELGIPIAYIGRYDEAAFLAYACDMVPTEWVGRRYGYGSWLKRNPGHELMEMFAEPVYEMYLKTTGRVYMGIDLPCDDPFMQIQDDGAWLCQPKLPLNQQTAILITDYPLKDDWGKLAECMRILQATFLAVEKAWVNLGYKFVDLKIEIGITKDGRVVLADVIDNDSWRVLTQEDKHLDKEVYRRKGSAALDEVEQLYGFVAQLTGAFPAMAS
ncbi:MAG: phosphoribosylaminoimidazolesuccinocarboxamide synthase [Minisyncoccales bacterium]